MTSRRRQRTAAALVLLVACRPLIYTLDEDGHGGHTTGETTDDPTGPHSTDPNPTDSGPPNPSGPDSCFNGGLDDGESDVDCGGPCPPCHDGAKCMSPADCLSDACVFGVCAARECTGDDDCKTEDPCQMPVCDPGSGTCFEVPRLDGEPCDDADPCTDGNVCVTGKCLGIPRTCDELAGPCRKPFCNSITGNCAVEFEQPGSPCEDGLKCSEFDTCDELGECIGQTPQPLFSDSFLMQLGWTTDPMWQIGPAVASMCGPPGSDDPFTDHTGDEFLAGLLIGECTPPDGFPKNCLTSPPIEMGFGNELELRFWSVLNNAGAPMIATVEWFDGQVWNLLHSFEEPVFDKEWTERALVIPFFMQPPLQVRFCQSQMGPAMLSVGGWSVDDVTVGPPQCAP